MTLLIGTPIRLEIAATHTKQITEVISNRNEIATFARTDKGHTDAVYGGESDLLPEFRAEAANQFRRELRDVHAFRNHELAAQDRTRLIVIRELAIHLAILAFLIPAKSAIRDCVGADELKAAQHGIPIRNKESFPEDIDFNESFKWTKNFGHGRHSPGVPAWRLR
ncbi:MAG: hypothetical protein WBL70_19945 [Candidatus Acidiferrales bacterium]